jgi:replicative superfamily II helicase
MVDFKKRLGNKAIARPLDPLKIYEFLDRASDKGPLRPVQLAVLKEWHESRRKERDIIIKLHTGQGKTLIGLSILQSRLNEDVGPVLYLCPNNFLVTQTSAQAAEFGFACVVARGMDDLPGEFIDGKAILITSVQKLFNGLSKFGLGARSLAVGAMVVDDSHACIDAIRDACVIRLGSEHTAYADIMQLFGPELERQGAGSYYDIQQHKYDAFLPVPYWDWTDKATDVASILSRHTKSDEVRFGWPILKDRLEDCLCIVSGTELEISPYLPPLHLFGSYDRATYRVFMSATVTNDSFLVKGLGLARDVITNPLIDKNERWAGEKMIVIPSLIDSALNRGKIVQVFAQPVAGRKSGVVALTPSFSACQDWRAYGAEVADRFNIEGHVERLKNGDCEKTLVLANRYDGIDLPDRSCRVLILDSTPFSEHLFDRYAERCRGDSEVIATRRARMIEQGLGRSVRGEKDFSVIILTGPDLVKAVRTKQSRKYFSAQTQMQIEIGMALAEFAKEEVGDSGYFEAFRSLVNQCLKRDQDWKEFYVQKMNEIASKTVETKILAVFSKEKAAELLYEKGDYERAVATIQELIDESVTTDFERGWYLQGMGRYIYPASKHRSNGYQVNAHKTNRFLLRPRKGMQITKVALVAQRRIANVVAWAQAFETYEELSLSLENTLSNLRFGVEADAFERALNELGTALGFKCERPDKEWKEGPDNLWALRDNEYLLAECKSEVKLTRDSINKDETGQMNNSCAWFRRTYGDVQVKRIMIIPTKKVGPGAGFTEEVEIMREKNLKRLVANARSFFDEFKELDRKDLSDSKVQVLIDLHGLGVDVLIGNYSERPVQL